MELTASDTTAAKRKHKWNWNLAKIGQWSETREEGWERGGASDKLAEVTEMAKKLQHCIIFISRKYMKVVVIDIILYHTIYIQYIQYTQYMWNIYSYRNYVLYMMFFSDGNSHMWHKGRGRKGGGAASVFVQVYEYLFALFCYFWFSAPPSRAQNRLNFRRKRCPLTPYARSKPLFRSPLVFFWLVGGWLVY